jgi:ParB/RepB/Spo0J family partition protein
MPEPCALQEIPIEKISTGDDVKKTVYSNLERSINTLGRVLQNVILVQEDHETYSVYAGKRRILAAKEAGLPRIPAMVFDKSTPEAVLAMFLISENMIRWPNPGMEAEALGTVMRSYGWTAEQIAKKLGIPVNHVRDRIRLLRFLIPVFMERLKEGRITLSAAKKLCSLSHEAQQELAAEEKLTIDMIEKKTKSAKLDELMAQDELFVVPSIDSSGSLAIVKEELKKAMVSANGGGKLLKKALDLIEQYETREQGGKNHE